MQTVLLKFYQIYENHELFNFFRPNNKFKIKIEIRLTKKYKIKINNKIIKTKIAKTSNK